jgi:hypothetical protein
VASSIWYGAFSPLEARALGSGALDSGRPSPRKALLEQLRSVLVGTVVAGVARAAHLHSVGSTVLFSDAGVRELPEQAARPVLVYAREG